jgi:WD40 repeat protein
MPDVAAPDISDADGGDGPDDSEDSERLAQVAEPRPRSEVIALCNVASRNGSSDVPTSTVHWHSHPVWCTAFSPDGSFLLSGGEEAVVVVWQVC